MSQFWPALFAGLAVVAMGWAVSSAGKPLRARARKWWANQMAAADEAEEFAEEDQLATLREQVADRARKLGVSMPVRFSGRGVEYADGHVTVFIPDFQTYRRMMESRRVDIFTTVNREPPTPLSHRDRRWLVQWLAENPES
jgi:hypothetical protein